ncbi:hypothetical protein, partial [Klebsiella aerogenes]|uniref:hypothetical protein n=1 Tax=Klebsiella aerogenes TaxID=548 RepID=UPI0013D3124B
MTIRIIGGNGTERVTQTLPDGKPADVPVKQDAKTADTAPAKDQPRNYELTLDTNATVGLINNGTVHSE